MGGTHSRFTDQDFARTGALSDRWGRKWLIVVGMWIQTIGILTFILGRGFWA
jgi:hypothetical protein